MLAIAALLWTYRGSYEDPRFRRPTTVSFREGIAAPAPQSGVPRALGGERARGTLAAFVSALFLFVLEYVAGISDPLIQGSMFIANIAGALASYPSGCPLRGAGARRSRSGSGSWSRRSRHERVRAAPWRAGAAGRRDDLRGRRERRFWTLLYALNADIAELDELETGERREGLFAGFAALLRKCAFAFAAGSVGVGLDLIGYRPHAVQSDATLLGIKLLFAVPTTFLIVAAWLVFRRFPLTPERWAEIAVQLDARRGA